MRKRLWEDVLKDFKRVHGNTYDYSLVQYKGMNINIDIICNKHGVFHQRPGNHLQGKGCPYCNGGIKKTQDEVIQEFRNIHGNKYDYSKTEYENDSTKICIECHKKDKYGNEHGEFWQRPNCHKNGKGCPKCKAEKTSERCLDTKEDFMRKSMNKHGSLYDYSEVDYVSDTVPVCIKCKKHGIFWQTPSKHKQGHGCPKCNISHLEAIIENLLKKYSIKYISQQRFDWLLSFKNYKMSLDFYLPDYNIAIECQGVQHYEPNGFYSEECVNSQKERDTLKLNLCIEHGINIYYIKYNEDIEESIIKLLTFLNISLEDESHNSS